MTSADLDIAVLGSGFGGSLTALIAKQLGFTVAVFDRAKHPRFAIGESSTPLADRLLGSLADRYDLPFLIPLTHYGSWKERHPDLGVGRKRGFSYLRHRPGAEFDCRPGDLLMIAASESDQLSDTHWLRADVDHWFARQCAAADIDVYERFDARLDRAGGRWSISPADGGGPEATARLVVDATGPAALVPKYLGIENIDPEEFRTHSSAVYGHWTGIPKVASFNKINDSSFPFAIDDAAVHHLLEEGWMWQLRFDDNRVSMGICFDGEDAVTEEWLPATLFRYPTLGLQVAQANGPPSNMTATSRLQRRLAQVAGDDWVALPHTIGFVDPMHSTGIAMTLGGVAKLARALERWDREGPAPIDDWGMAPVVDEVNRIDQLVSFAYQQRCSPRGFEAAALLYTACAMACETSASEPTELFVDPDRHLDGLLSQLDNPRVKAMNGDQLIDWVRAGADQIGITQIAEPQVPGMYAATATKG